MTYEILFWVLALVVGFHLILTFGLIARIRALQTIVEDQAADPDRKLPARGEHIGPFATVAANGEPVSDAELRGGTTLVGFFAPGCKPCEETKAELLARPPGVPLLAFVDGSAEDPNAAALVAALCSVGRAAYTQYDDPITRAFRPSGFPTLFRIEHGAVAATGHRLREVLP